MQINYDNSITFSGSHSKQQLINKGNYRLIESPSFTFERIHQQDALNSGTRSVAKSYSVDPKLPCIPEEQELMNKDKDYFNYLNNTSLSIGQAIFPKFSL